MQEKRTEIIINRTRIIFATFFLITGIFSKLSGSVPSVWMSIFAVTFAYYLLALVNFLLLRKGTMPMQMIYFSITMEVLLLFSVKFAFHYDPYNGFGMTVKEQATFLVYFLFGIINGLRYNKRINIYYGSIAIISYALLVVMGLTAGGMYFSRDPRDIFSSNTLRVATEGAKFLFMGVFTYFLQLMADFTNKNVKKIEDARSKSDKNYQAITHLLGTVKKAADDLSSSSRDLSKSTNSISTIIDKNNKMIKDITEIATNFSKNVGEMRKKIQIQNSSIEENFSKIRDISGLMDTVYRESSEQSKKAGIAINLAELNEKHIRESSISMRLMQENSKKIEEITKTINEISDQTNLLSLNAAIESARAGDYGKGFAVVSDEISKLAGKSSDSSKEISTIIKITVDNIDTVSKTVEEMSEGLNKIIEFVKENSLFIQNLKEKTEREFHDSKALYTSTVEIDTNTKNVIEHFNNQTELILQILEWMERMSEMSERVSEQLNSLMILSAALEKSSEEINNKLMEIKD